MDKLSSLFKIAILKDARWFGDTRNLLKRLYSKGVEVTRYNGEPSEFGQILYKNKNKPILNYVNIRRDAEKPVSTLFHEGGGHFTQFKDKAMVDHSQFNAIDRLNENIKNLKLKGRKRKIFFRKEKRKIIKDIKKNEQPAIERLKELKAERIANNNALQFITDKNDRKKYLDYSSKNYKTYTDLAKNRLNSKTTKQFEYSSLNPSLNKKPWVR